MQRIPRPASSAGPCRPRVDSPRTDQSSPAANAPPPPAGSAPQCQPANTGKLCLADLTRGAKTVRDLQADGSGRLWFSADQCIVGWTPGRDGSPLLLHSPAVIESLLVAEDSIYAGLANGAVLRWTASNPCGDPDRIRGDGNAAVGSLAWLSGGGVPRLLIADGRSQLDLHVLGDSYRGEYRCEQRLRWGFAADDYLIGVNDQRDRVLIWRIDDPEKTTAILHIGRLCGHSVQDVVLLQETRAPSGG